MVVRVKGLEQLPVATSVSNTDLLIVQQGSGNTAITKSVQAATLIKKMSGVAAWTTITTNYLASDGDRLICNTSGGSFSITLPSSGGEVVIKDAGNSFNTSPVTVLGNGRTILGSNNIICDASGYQVSFTSVSNTWIYRLNYNYGS